VLTRGIDRSIHHDGDKLFPFRPDPYLFIVIYFNVNDIRATTDWAIFNVLLTGTR